MNIIKYIIILLIINYIEKKKRFKSNKIRITQKNIDKISIIIPYYNEEKVIYNTLKKIVNLDLNGELILVNNSSNDSSIIIVEEFIKKYNINNNNLNINHIFCSNRGKGNAILSGLKIVKYDTILLTDADGEYSIEEYPKLINKYKELDNTYVQVIAIRNKEINKDFNIQKSSFIILHNLILGTNYNNSDIYMSGTRVISKQIINYILDKEMLTEGKFTIEMNLNYELCKFGNYFLLPIKYKRRTINEGKKLIKKEKKIYMIHSIKFLLKNILINNRKKKSNELINNKRLHLGIILDGNRRFSKNINKSSKKFQHLIGLIKLNEILSYCKISKYNIKYLTLYCFAENNWKRSQKEIDNIFNLLNNLLEKYKKNNNNIKINILSSDISNFSDKIKNQINEINIISNNIVNEDLNCNILLSYSGQQDIINACKNYYSDKNREILNKENFRKYLLTKDFPDIDVLIRTGGNKRLSDYILYDIAYSEIYFLNKTFPELTTQDINNILDKYSNVKINLGK